MRGSGKGEIAGSGDNTTAVSLTNITVHDNSNNHSNNHNTNSNSNSNPPTPRESSNNAGGSPGQHDNAAFVMDERNGNLTPDGNPPSGRSNGTTGGQSNRLEVDTTIIGTDPSSEDKYRRRHRSEGQVSNKSMTDDISNKMLQKSSAKSSMVSINKYDDAFYDESGLTLIFSRHEKVALKDFSNEVRAARDIDSSLKNMVLMLHMHNTSVDGIVEECLAKMLADQTSRVYDQAKAALFTHDFEAILEMCRMKTLTNQSPKEHDQAKVAISRNDVVHQLSKTIQCTGISEGGGFDYDQSWICATSTVTALTSRRVCIARLSQPANLGQTCQEVQFLIVILVPAKEKETKSSLEVARTFGTLFSNVNIRQELLEATTEDAFRDVLSKGAIQLAEQHSKADIKIEMTVEGPKIRCGFMRGIRDDLRRRLPHYFSDYKDGVADKKSIAKTVSCTFFLYFACILPCIAFGVLNAANTKNVLTVEKVIYSQVFGGMIFAIFGGTPQIVLLTTAPLALYTQIIYSLSDQFDIEFQAFFACVGLFNCLFLVIFSIFDLSILMQFSTRSSEEIFALFISIAFSVDAFKNCAKSFDHHYNCDPDGTTPTTSPINATTSSLSTPASTLVSLLQNVTAPSVGNTTGLPMEQEESFLCAKEITLLYLLLLLGTLWLGVTLFTFNKTPYLTAGKRELLADYALPVSVVIMTFIGAYLFRDVPMGKSFELSSDGSFFTWVDMSSLSWQAILGACGLGFCLSLLFFMDQNISAALVNAPQNKMKKGSAYHWDLLVIAAINTVLSLLCFPWVHAALPHSPLHVMALADVEERVDQGHIYQIVVKVRETRLTCIFSHILIGLSLLFLSILAYIPTPVLYGLFLYVAVTSLFGNQMFERIQLFFTEQSAYPPNHYIRRVPQRKMHTFTGIQLLQLVVLCGVGFAPYPYLKMFFPVLIFALIPIRHKVIPKLVEQKYLKAMDGH